MKAIMEVYGALIVLILMLGTGLQVSGATEKAAQAKRYHAEAVSEIENSNFNPGVVCVCYHFVFLADVVRWNAWTDYNAVYGRTARIGGLCSIL